MARNLKQVSATGDVVAGTAVVHSVTLTPAAAAATVVVRDSSSGDARLTLAAAANAATVIWASGSGGDGVLFSTAVHVTVTGAGAVVSVEYS